MGGDRRDRQRRHGCELGQDALALRRHSDARPTRATGLVGKAMAQQSTDEQGVCLGVTTYGVVRGHEDFDLLQERTGNKGVERVHAYDTHALRRRGAETEERRIRIGPNGLAE